MSRSHATRNPKNNGKLAHQHVFHVHFHLIPKPDETHGIVFSEQAWPRTEQSMDVLKQVHAGILGKL